MISLKLLVIWSIICTGHQGFSSSQECNLILHFVHTYTLFVKRIPQVTYPYFAVCTDKNATIEYNNAVEAFNDAVKNESCAANFNHSKLNVVHMLYDQLTNIWETAHCNDCVSNKNDTDTFFEQIGDLDSCIARATLNPCDACVDDYTKVQVYYEHLVQSRKGSICFDIQDRMNQTRYAWSAKYNCCKDKQHSQQAFIAFASTISCLPVLFYLLMYVITRRKEAREQAALPPLDDQSSNTTVASTTRREEPQASTSNSTDLMPVHSEDEPELSKSKFDDHEAKLNNLDHQTKNRDGKLIDLVNDNSSISGVLNLENGAKPILVKDDDDVSILDAMKVVSGRNLLD